MILGKKFGGTAADRIPRVLKEGGEGALEGLLVGGQHILGVSNAQVPFEEGDLAASGSVTSEGQKVAISYDTDYAVRQHEDMSLRHDSGRNAKFLENAINSEKDRVLAFIAQGIQRRLGL